MVIAPSPFEPFVGQKTILLTTFKRDGTPVGTAVSIAVEGDRAFVRTYDAAGKAKRMRNNPEVEIAPCTMKGTPIGPAMHARARLLTGEDAVRAARALAGKYPFLHRALVPFLHRVRHYQTLHYELRTSGG
ncbi:PPOX class F420-dependent oxidoreductase [Pseudonocardia alaniniphila]|uniref:PPOX class F420-dependent oxidoreductase n=1 Tax=Pseudonocardia alaniniphila TaxID=75291 RepID=A0ABS9TTR8_9PSEU|nr:PPOX class F420-dependent oxidoreductase [Pseudonocardia alaniniphila]MCH6171886.1 PPOX class F420-dependent oxidoreductase [Pseudonocardia alaniniphila]